MFAEAFARKSSSSYDILRDIAGYTRSTVVGRNVTTSTAFEVATVSAVCRVIANGIAQVPFKLMRESADGKTRMPAKDHPLYEILAYRPNQWQTSFEYREMLALHLVLCGNAFSFVNRSNRAGVMELIPFEPGMVTVRRGDDFGLTYEVRAANGSAQMFPAKSIWHLRGPSWNSWFGLEAVKLAREAIGLAMACEESQARMHKNGVRPSGVYSVEGTLKDDQYQALSEWIDKNMAGTENTGKALILDRAAKWQSTQMTGIDAQTIETRRYQVEEICRHALVNPIMVFAESKNTTYASAEQMFLAHVVHSLAPHYMRIEQSVDANLLTESDRKDGLYSSFVDAGLLRGSITNQKDVILGYVNGGVMTANEGRAKLDMNPDPDPDSDTLRIPANITGALPDPVGAATAKSVQDILSEIKRIETKDSVINVSPAAVNVDARSTINLPEQKAGDVTVTVPEREIYLEANMPEIKIQPAQVIINQPGETVDTIERDPESKEITRITRKVKD